MVGHWSWDLSIGGSFLAQAVPHRLNGFRFAVVI
jgi:hypothetical protein